MNFELTVTKIGDAVRFLLPDGVHLPFHLETRSAQMLIDEGRVKGRILSIKRENGRYFRKILIGYGVYVQGKMEDVWSAPILFSTI